VNGSRRRTNPFRPTTYIPRISQIAFSKLKADGINGVIVDLDNTLVGYRALEPDEADAAWVRRAAQNGVRIVMVTNNSTPWASAIAAKLEIPIVANARKPLGRGFRRALRHLRMTKDEVVVIGDQLFTDVLGAKLAGLKVILVDPLVRHDPWNTLPLRLMERLLLRDLPRTHDDLAERTDL
jgi:HAD superfamily phosphatase (TIGR01668 family)